MTVVALDFDGVICDSVDELAASGFRAAGSLWPSEIPKQIPSDYFNQFRLLRPVIETGFESILLSRMIIGQLNPDEIFTSFKVLCKQTMNTYQIPREYLITQFSQVRNNWIREDPAGWLNHHRFYRNIPFILSELLKQCQVYIITTKEKKFAQRLLKLIEIPIKSNNIFGLKEGKKWTVLQRLISNGDENEGGFFYIDDRFKTLQKLSGISELTGVKLYLATWGYNVEEDHMSALEHTRIGMLNYDEFGIFQFMLE